MTTVWHEHLDASEERDVVAGAYPGARFRPDAWRVPMSPVRDDDAQFRMVAADLMRGEIVYLLPGGELAHAPDCQHTVHEVSGLRRPPSRLFRVDLSFPATAFGPAGPVNPKARIGAGPLGSFGLTPGMQELRYLGHPHLSGDGRGDAWACPLPPHDTEWTWQSGAVLAYLDQVAIWLFKTEVWAATRKWPLYTGLWLGEAAGHAPVEVLAYSAEGACRCGSGRRYGDCHRALDLREWFKRAA